MPEHDCAFYVRVVHEHSLCERFMNLGLSLNVFMLTKRPRVSLLSSGVHDLVIHSTNYLPKALSRRMRDDNVICEVAVDSIYCRIDDVWCKVRIGLRLWLRSKHY